MLKIRDLPGIADLEVKLLIQRNAYEGAEEDFCKQVSERLFGVWVTDDDELFEAHYDDTFMAFEFADDEIMTMMLTLGIDFSNEQGQPLRCTRWLAGPAEFAARGFAGHLPDNVDRFASNLQRDRDAFIASKRRHG